MAEVYHQADLELMQNKGKQIYESKVKHRDGSLHDVIFNKAAITNNQGKCSGLVGIMVDITERKMFERRINRLLKLKEAMLEVNQAIIGIKNITKLIELILEKVTQSMENADLSCVLVLDEDENLKIAACRGYDAEEAKKFSIKLKESFTWHKTNGNFKKTIIINDIQEMVKGQFASILKNTKGITVESSISAPILIEGKLYGFVNVDSKHNHVYDQTDLEMMEYMRNQIEIAVSKHQLYEQTIYLSRYDKLTNVYNRSYFEELFEIHIDQALRYNRSFCLVVFDINGLKIINDTYGHLAGDELIKTFASKLKECIRSSDIFARYGGDEFVAVFPDADGQVLTKKFENIIEEFKKNKITFRKNNFICSFSYGISNFPQDGNSYKKLVKTADERMYKYKQLKKYRQTMSIISFPEL